MMHGWYLWRRWLLERERVGLRSDAILLDIYVMIRQDARGRLIRQYVHNHHFPLPYHSTVDLVDLVEDRFIINPFITTIYFAIS